VPAHLLSHLTDSILPCPPPPLPLPPPLQDSWLPDPRLIIHIKNARRTHHGGTSEVYNHSGGFNKERYRHVWEVGGSPGVVAMTS
jgi:hypothetical protein